MSQQALGFIEAIVIDVSDLDRSMAFWTAITGQTSGPSFEPNFRRAKFEHGPALVLQEVREVKSGKNRVHLDIEVSNLDEALRRVTSVGDDSLPTSTTSSAVSSSVRILMATSSA